MIRDANTKAEISEKELIVIPSNLYILMLQKLKDLLRQSELATLQALDEADVYAAESSQVTLELKRSQNALAELRLQLEAQDKELSVISDYLAISHRV